MADPALTVVNTVLLVSASTVKFLFPLMFNVVNAAPPFTNSILLAFVAVVTF